MSKKLIIGIIGGVTIIAGTGIYLSRRLPEGISNGDLIKSPSSAVVYLVKLGRKRPLTSTAFSNLGFSFNDVKTIPENTINLIKTGKTISE